MKVFVLSLVMVTFMGGTAYAEEGSDDSTILNNFIQSCEKNGRMDRFYDCDCLSKEFLGEYKKSAGKGSYSSLLGKITHTCPDVPSIEKLAQRECKVDIKQRKMMYKMTRRPSPEDLKSLDASIDEYCGCYVENFRTKLVAKMTDNIRKHSGIKRSAKKACDSLLPSGFM